MSSSSSHPPLPPSSSLDEPTPSPEFHFAPATFLGRIETLFAYLESPSSVTYFPVLLMYLLTFLAGSYSLARELWTKPAEESLVWSNAWAGAIVWIFYEKTRAKWETRRVWLKELREKREDEEREAGGRLGEGALVEEKEKEKEKGVEVCRLERYHQLLFGPRSLTQDWSHTSVSPSTSHSSQ